MGLLSACDLHVPCEQSANKFSRDEWAQCMIALSVDSKKKLKVALFFLVCDLSSKHQKNSHVSQPSLVEQT